MMTCVPTEFRFRKKNGEYIELEVVAQNFLDVPAIKSIIVTSRNMKERKNYEADLINNGKRYGAFIKQTTEGISRMEVNPPMSLDLDEIEQARYYLQNARLAECNEAFTKMYGVENGKDLIGKRLSDFWIGTEEEHIASLLPWIKNRFTMGNMVSTEKMLLVILFIL